MDENSELPNESVRLPLWLKLICVILACGLLYFLVHHSLKKKGDNPMTIYAKKSSSVTYPMNINTEWRDITVRIDSVARIDDKTIVAEWAYCNNSENSSESFSWGFSQPNYVELSKIIDANKREYSVAVNAAGEPICASTNRDEHSGWAKPIFGARDLPVWAKFAVPEDAPGPLYLHLFGLVHKGRSEVEVALLSIDEQHERAYLPHATSWPDIFVQLIDITRQGANTIEVKWRYVNKNETNRFTWGMNQPNFVAFTQVYDYSTGKLYDIARSNVQRSGKPMCSSTNINDDSNWSESIEPGGALDANAVFKGVKGQNIQILFHGAMPLFYNPEKVSDHQSTKTN